MSLKGFTGSDEKNPESNPALSQGTIDSLPVGIVAIDARLAIVQLNDWAVQITGCTASRALGRKCPEVLQCSGCAKDCRLLRNLSPEAPVGQSEITITGRQGAEIVLRINTAARFRRDGAMTGAVHVFQVISGLKSARREKRNLLPMVTHDVKSSLAIMGGFVLRMVKKEDSLTAQKRRNYCTIISREIRKLESMMDDFLEFSRYSSKGYTPKYRSVNLADELRYLAGAYKPACEEHGIALKLELTDPLSELEADAEGLQRVFSNLLNNALTYSPRKSVITLSARSSDSAVTIEIKDRGAGIAPEELPHIFDAFKRGNGSGAKHGFGVGLAVVKEIVEAHGGSVEATSVPGNGTTFTIILPRCRTGSMPCRA